MTNAIDNSVMFAKQRQRINRNWFAKLHKTQHIFLQRAGYNNRGCENIIKSYNLLLQNYPHLKP